MCFTLRLHMSAAPPQGGLTQALGPMNKLPTDHQILERIYAEYRVDFRNYSKEEGKRESKIYVPIDIKDIASRLETDPHELFGRLYYHLDHKYHYKKDDGANVHLFAFAIKDDRHCINFPYLAAILSEHRSTHSRDNWSLWLSAGSLTIALAALLAQYLGSRA